MQVQDHQELAVCKDHTQIIKGKRTKRQRLPSPLSLAAMPSSTNSGGADLATTSPSIELRDRTTEEEDEDMANCLILLAQGHHQTQKLEKASSHAQHVQAEPDDDHPNNNNRSSSTSRLYLYQCKTCDRCFPSFQALGGHRASHKKPKPTNVSVSGTVEEKQQAITTTFVDHQYDSTTNTMLSLQMPNRALYSINTTTGTSIKSKVHECSMCGAQFSSGQALGGHMRRHRTFVSTSSTTISMSCGSPEETKKPRNVLKLDLNHPAPDDNDHRESKFPFQPNEKVIVFSASPWVDCHY